MPKRDSISEALDGLRSELDAAERRVEKLRAAISALGDLTDGEPIAPGQRRSGHAPTGASSLRGMTLAKAAAVVLKEAGRPLHVTEIARRMEEGGFRPGTPTMFKASLVGSLDRWSKDETGWFTKPEPATYTLRRVPSDQHEIGLNGREAPAGTR